MDKKLDLRTQKNICCLNQSIRRIIARKIFRGDYNQ